MNTTPGVQDPDIKHYSAVFDTIYETFFICNSVNWMVLEANRKMTALFGYSAEELRKRTLFDLFCQPIPTREDLDSIKAGETGKYRWKIQDPRKNYYPVEIHLALFKTAKEPCVLATIHGIPGEKHYEQNYRDSRESHRFPGEIKGNGIALCNHSGVLTFVNDRFCQLINHRRDEILGLHLDKVIPITWKNHFRKYFSKNQKNTAQFEFDVTGNNGNPVRIKTDIRVVPDTNNHHQSSIITIRDITRIRHWEKLAGNENFFNKVMDSMFDVIVILDTQGNFLYLSSSTRTVFGYEPEELLGKNALETIHPEDAPVMLQRFFKFALSPAPAEPIDPEARTELVEFRIRHADGHWVYVEVQGNKAFYEHRIEGIVFLMRDISQKIINEEKQRKIRRELQEQYELYQFVTNNIQDTIWIIDHNLRIIYISPSIRTMCGFDPDEILGQRIHRFISQDSLETAINKLKLLLKNQNSNFTTFSSETEMEFYHKEGSTVWTENRITLMQNEEGEIDRILGIARDITQQRKNQEIKRESEEKFRTLVETIQDFVFICDESGNITFANSSFQDTVCSQDSPDNPLKIFDFIHPEDRRSFETGFFLGLEADKPVTNLETRIISATGEIIYLSFNLSPTKNLKGEITTITAVGHDITFRKKVEQDLVEKNRELNDFAYMVSHELKNPIQVMRGFLNLIKNDLTLFDKFYQRVMKQSDQLLYFIDDMLKLSRAGRIIGEKSLVNIPFLLKKVFITSKPESLPGELILEETLPSFLHADPKGMEQVFLNLIKNSINYRDPEKEKIIISIGAKSTDNHKIISIRDNGTGILPEHLEKIFEVGFTLKREGGTGFGLAIVKKIIEAHGGTIEVFSKGENQGTEFSLVLPADSVKGESLEKCLPKPQRENNERD